MDQAICTTDFKFSSDVLQLIDYYEEECDNTNCPKKIERISDLSFTVKIRRNKSQSK